MTIRHAVAAIALSLAALGAAANTVEQGISLVRDGKNAEAVKVFTPLAESGNAAAQFQLGMLYYLGKGVAENEKRAVEWLTKSAGQGNVEAMYQLGNAFTFGSETPKLVQDSDIEAAQWYFKAAKAGSIDAQYSLGLLFMAGKGVDKNDKEASYWMQQAANGGHADAKNYLSGKGK